MSHRSRSHNVTRVVSLYKSLNSKGFVALRLLRSLQPLASIGAREPRREPIERVGHVKGWLLVVVKRISIDFRHLDCADLIAASS
jgi:hypothetical protein